MKFPKGSIVLVKTKNVIGRVDHFRHNEQKYYILEIEEPFLIYDGFKEDELESLEIEEKDLAQYVKIFNRLHPKKSKFDLNDFFKEVYADKLQDLIPGGVKLANKSSFKSINPGKSYHQPVILDSEHGITFDEKKKKE